MAAGFFLPVAAAAVAAVVVDEVPTTAAAVYPANDTDTAVCEMLAGIAGKPASMAGEVGVAGHAVAEVVSGLVGLHDVT